MRDRTIGSSGSQPASPYLPHQKRSDIGFVLRFEPGSCVEFSNPWPVDFDVATEASVGLACLSAKFAKQFDPDLTSAVLWADGQVENTDLAFPAIGVEPATALSIGGDDRVLRLWEFAFVE